MQIECACGLMLSNTGQPNDVECLLVPSRSIEKLQDLIDEEVATNGSVDMWPEHWEESGAIEVWRCRQCGRLYFNANKSRENIVVYNIEKTGI